MSTVKYNFPNAKAGDSYDDVQFVVKVNGVLKDLTGSTIKMKAIPDGGNTITEYSTTNGKIVLTDATNGVFTIVFGIIDLPPKIYNYSIQITFSNGKKKTWIEGIINVMK